MLRESSKSNKFENFLLIFILLQPILDLLTAFCIMVLKIDTTIGVITRLFVMFLSGIYILIQTRKRESIKYISYIILVGIVFTIGLINNKFTKNPMVLTEEIKFIAKALYPFVMLTCYVFVFKSLKEKGHSKMRDYITYASLIIGVVMVASIATGTDYNSYEWLKLGSRGWFYAGNELGSILAIMCPIVILYSIEKTKSIGKVYYWIPSVLVVYSLFAIGTKVGVGAIFATMAIAVVMCFIQAFTQRKDGKKNVYLLNGFVAMTVFVGILAYTPFSPFMKNMGVHFQLIEQQQSAKQEEKKKEEAKEHKLPATEKEKAQEKEREKEKAAEKKEETQAIIFSGRQLFEQMYKDFYKEAPTSQKLLGMGYAGNYKEQPKLIERDFHDWFYSFGIIGFILLIVPFLYFGIKFIVCVFTKFKQVFTVRYAMVVAAILLGLGISFIAGHILMAPGVSFYLVLLMAYLIVDLGIE
ncbi:O-antigen ligase family protein [Bacillus sp. NPDC094077]|uniref:O-antigen ligase family protein n=1 Tax=Bacillus sp. NPDC094077 TaxID=3390932 RepID=UPI003CFC9EE3